MKFQFHTKFLARQSLIAALYVILTLSGLGVSYGPIQFRYSEIMTWMAFFDPKSVIGLTLGCLIANIWSPFGLIDMLIGTLGTLLSTLCMSRTRSKWIAMLWPSVFSFLYSGEAWFLGQIPGALFPLVTLQIMLSEFLIVGVIGLPVMSLITRNARVRALLDDAPPQLNRSE